MATSIATPAASADGGMDGILDGALDTAPATGDTTPEAETQTDDTSAEDAPVTDAPAEGDDEAAPVADDDDADPEQVTQDGRNAYKMSEPHMQRLVAARKFADGVQEFAPSVEAARKHFERANDLRFMEADFASGDPAGIDKFLDYFGNPGKGVSPQGMGMVAQRLLGHLESVGNSAAIRQIEGQVSGALINRAYAAARQSVEQNGADSKAAQAALYKAQSLDFALNGKHHTLEQIPQANPQQNQQQAEQRGAREVEQRWNQLVQTQWGQFDQQNLTGAKDAAMKAGLDKIFEPVKASYPEGVLGAIRNQVAATVEKQIKGDFEWSQNHKIDLDEIQREFSQAIRNNQRLNLTPRVTAAVQDYTARIARLIPAIAKPLLNGATQQAVAKSKETHAKLAAGQKGAPSGGGKAPNRNLLGSLTGKETADQLLDAVFG